MTLVQSNVRTITLRSFVNDITSYRSDAIGASKTSAGVDSSSTPAEPAERSTNQKHRIFLPRDGRRRETCRSGSRLSLFVASLNQMIQRLDDKRERVETSS